MIYPRAKKLYLEMEALQPQGGIVLPENMYVVERAKVLAVGPEVTEVVVGDVVLYKTWALDTVEIGEEKHCFLDEDMVLAKYVSA